VSLKTQDHAVAKRRAAVLEAQWRTQIAKAASEDPLQADIEFWREAIRDTEEDLQEVVRGLLQDEAERRHPHDEGAAVRFYKQATGELVPFAEHVEAWAASLEGEAKTTAMKRSTVREFSKLCQCVQDATGRLVQDWANDLTAAGVKAKTIGRKLSELRGYWAYLQHHGVAPEDALPFAKVTLQGPARKSRNGGKIRQAFRPADVVGLLQAAIDAADESLADLIRLGMWTGARIEELCSLKVTAVDLAQHFFQVEDAKTEAGVRQVPIHSKLMPTMVRLVEGSTDGYVLSGLTFNKFGDRSNAVGKRFGRLKARMAYGEALVFHSIRRTVATLMENAGVPEGVAADIVGHEKPTMTYGLYSGGNELAVKREAIEKLVYPA
jgi:integrase